MDRELVQALLIQVLAWLGVVTTLTLMIAMWFVAPTWFCCAAIVPLCWSLFACSFALDDGPGGG